MMRLSLKMVVKTHMSSTDPTTEQEDGCNLDKENRYLQRSCFDKSCIKSYQLMIFIVVLFESMLHKSN